METILHRFSATVARQGEATAFLYKDKTSGSWQGITWRDAFQSIVNLSSELKRFGVKKGDSVGIISSTRYEWTIIDLAILSTGAISIPVYNNLAIDQTMYILNHSVTKVLFVENLQILDQVIKNKESLPHLDTIILIEGEADGVPSYSDMIKVNVPQPTEYYQRLIEDRKRDDLATCIYTSGTTGEPKGVEITHANIIGEVCGLSEIFNFKKEETGLLFLPLAHVLARAMQFHQVSEGYIYAYAESVAKLPENMLEVAPQFMVAVPRVIEKIYEKILNEVREGSFAKKFLFKKSVALGLSAGKKLRMHKKLSIFELAEYWLVKKVVFSKLHRNLGGRLRLMVSGGAPLNKDVAEFFHAIGLLILEGYGLTETTAAVTLNRFDDYKFGTVGKPLDGVQIQISADGEILLKGPQIFRGYRAPMKDGDASPFVDGWLKTGDIGEFSRDGFLRVTDRKKEIIVTASGKNIAPQWVEKVLRQSPYIKDIFIYGDKRKYLTALIVINNGRVREYLAGKGLHIDSDVDLVNNSSTYELIKNEIECRNEKLARHETIKRFTLIDHDFSMETGELTPTMKVRRHKVYHLYRDIIERMYE